MASQSERHALATTIFHLGIPLAVLAISLLALLARPRSATFSAATVFCMVAGLGLFLKAKLSLIRQGTLVSFGPSHMTLKNSRLYKAGYALMMIATLMALSLLVSLGALSS